MKKYILPFILLFLSIQSFTQSGGWRPGEMEVRVDLNTARETGALAEYQFNGEVYPGYALLYLVPEELEMIRKEGLSYEILKEDLNKYFRDFWQNREEYHSYDEIIQEMNSLSFSYSSICQKVNFGTSMGGRELTALKISDNVTTDEPEAEIGFDGGIHGDEIGGPENMIRFARHLCESYGNDPEITDLIDTREIWLYMMVNPDGRVNMVRYNNNGVDLNRDWGYMWDEWGGSPGAYSQVETKALRSWLYDNQFVIHTTYHSGTEFISYPWSYRPDQTPDHDHIDYLAALYSSVSGYSNLTYGQGYNGMYAINGSSKDTYYGVMGSVGWSMEISNSKQPPASMLMTYYNYNVPSMLAMIEYSGYGIEGTVTDAVTGEPVAALIFVDNGFPCYTDPEVGDYHKFLVQGTYTVKAVANGYASQTQYDITVGDGSVTTCDFSLQPGDGHYAYRVAASRIPENNHSDEGYTPAVFGEPDGVNYSIGKSGWVVIDLGKEVLDGPGEEVRIFEGDDTDEGYSAYAGPTIDGPWHLLGSTAGTASFDFSSTGLTEARYIRIQDDGDGNANVDNAGFDLDALQVLEQPQIVYLKMDLAVDDQESGNGNGRLDPGETAGLVISLRNHGGLTAIGTTANLNFDSTWLSVSSPDASFGDIPHSASSEAVITVSADASAPPEAIVMMVLNVTANEGDYTTSFPCHINIGPLVEDFESGDFLSYYWEFTNIPWVISPLNVYEGSFTAKSANIGDSQRSGLTLTMEVIGYDDISFYRKVSSEDGSDYLRFFIDGNLMGEWSGNLPWEKVEYQVTPGYHTFKWSFEKDEAISHGYDCGWIDYIVFPSFNVTGLPDVIANTMPLGYCMQTGGEVQLGAFPIGGTGSYNYAWTPNVSITGAGGQFPVASPDETTIYTVEVDDGLTIVDDDIKVSVWPDPDTPVILQQGDSLISSAQEGNQWYDEEGAIPGATGHVFYPEDEGDYYVIVTSLHGCLSEPSNVVYFQFVGLDEYSPGEKISVYPNPVTDLLNIRTASEGLSIELVQPDGRRIYASGMTDRSKTIDMSGLPPGIYLLYLRDDAGQIVGTAKIVRY